MFAEQLGFGVMNTRLDCESRDENKMGCEGRVIKIG